MPDAGAVATPAVDDSNTEPMPDLPPLPAKPPAPQFPSAFSRSRFQFMTGISAGETALIRAEDGSVLLTYRSFASVVGIVAALMSAVVFVAGITGVVFLFHEERPLPAIAALMLSLAFSATIVMLVPALKVTLYEAGNPAVTIAQESSVAFPSVTYIVATSDGNAIARIRKSFFSRFGRNRWQLLGPHDSHQIGDASEESLSAALTRKIAGKFDPRCQSNVQIHHDGSVAGAIIRRPDATGQADVLDLSPDSKLDRRVAVALATLVLGSEP